MATTPARPRLFGDDTHPEVERRLVEAYRRMTPVQKMAKVCELNRAVTMLAMAGVRAREPEISDREAEFRVAELRYGVGLIRRLRAHMVSSDGG